VVCGLRAPRWLAPTLEDSAALDRLDRERRAYHLAALSVNIDTSINRLMPDRDVEPLSGNAILNAVPVTVAPAD
jgi:hypothetical protein